MVSPSYKPSSCPQQCPCQILIQLSLYLLCRLRGVAFHIFYSPLHKLPLAPLQYWPPGMEWNIYYVCFVSCRQFCNWKWVLENPIWELLGKELIAGQKIRVLCCKWRAGGHGQIQDFVNKGIGPVAGTAWVVASLFLAPPTTGMGTLYHRRSGQRL